MECFLIITSRVARGTRLAGAAGETSIYKEKLEKCNILLEKEVTSFFLLTSFSTRVTRGAVKTRGSGLSRSAGSSRVTWGTSISLSAWVSWRTRRSRWSGKSLFNKLYAFENKVLLSIMF